MVTASAMTTSKAESSKGSAMISADVTVTRSAMPAARALASARSSISGEMSAAVTRAPWRRAIWIAVVATPHPTSSTRADSVICARRSNASVEARPPGWITRLPMTAMNLYGSRSLISRGASLVAMAAS